MSLETKRIKLRQWRKEDIDMFAEMNSYPDVMRYFPKPLTRIESDCMAQRCKSHIAEYGWGLWCAQLIDSGEFIGFVGIHRPLKIMPCSPCVEVGWRLNKRHWGMGYATEAAELVLSYGFEKLGLTELVSYTTVSNVRSRAVMERIGLKNTNQNFGHPEIEEDHPLFEHVLYKITKSSWQNLKL